MQGEKYKLKVYKSFLNWTHGMGYCIEEIYIPELGIVMNREAIFKTTSERYKKAEKLGNVEIDEKDVEAIQKYLSMKENVEKIVLKYLSR